MSQYPSDSDEALDARLRDVAVPAGLVARLQAIVESPLDGSAGSLESAASDVDLRLQDVVVREDFLQRLREIPARAKKRRKLVVALPLEESLCEVPLPRGFVARLRRIASSERATAIATPWAVAAALLVMAVVAGVGVLIGRATNFDRSSVAGLPTYPELDIVTADAELQLLDPGVTDFNRDDALEVVSEPSVAGLEHWLAANDAPAPADGIETAGIETAATSPVARWLPGGPDASKLMYDPRLKGVFGNPDRSFDEQPELWTLPGLRPRGIDPPANPEFDLLFLRRFGVHPFVSPRWLPETSVPLTVRPESFELTRRCLASGELPKPETVRTEEFLAAPDYRYRWPAPVGAALSIRTAAGPSPLARTENAAPLEMPLGMLHVGVQATELLPAPRQPVDVTVVVDLSGSMRWGGRLDMVRTALHEQIGRMHDGDRWNLVAFSEQAWVVAEDVSRQQAGQLHEAVESLFARTSTNVGAGLELGRVLNEDRPAEPGHARHVVLLSDGLSRLDAVSYDILRERFARQGPADPRLTLVALGLEQVADAQWTSLAQETQGRFVRAGSAAEIGWAMAESIDDRSSVVAQAVTMRVVFDPEQVESYRLLGHESFPVADLMPVPADVEFRSGQTGVALFELKLREPAKPGKRESSQQRDLSRGDVARVIVEWRDPANGAVRSVSQPVRRRQFAPTFAESAPALQRAVLAAATAEVLRGSYFARGVKMSDVAALADQLPPAVAAEPDVEQFVKLIRAVVTVGR